MADTTQSFNKTWTAPTKVGGRYIQAPLVQQDTGFFRNITQNAPSLENNYNLSRSGDFYDIWSNPQPLGLLVEPGVNPQHSRNYAFENQDFPEVMLDLQNAPATWGNPSLDSLNNPGVGTKIRNDLGNDPAIRSTLEQFPSKVLNPVYGEGAKPASMLPLATQEWENMVTAPEIDRLSSRLFGSGFFGNRLKNLARIENRWPPFSEPDWDDVKHFGEGRKGYFEKKDGTLMNPFDIMYYDEISSIPVDKVPTDTFGFRADDQTRFLDRTSSIRSPLDGFGSPIKDIPEGTFAPYQGPLGDPPTRDEWFQDDPDAFTLKEDAEASLYPIGATIGGDSLLEEPTTENLNTLLRNTLVPMEGITETVEPLPSGPEDMFRDWFPKGSIENQNTLLMNTLVPISTGSGIGGIIEDGVQTDFAPRDVMPVVTGPEDFVPVMPDLSAPFDPSLTLADESEVFGTFDSTTPGLIGDYLREQEQDFTLPSGPEEMQPQPKKKKKQETGGPSASDLRRLAEKSRKQAEEKEDRVRKEAKKSKAKVKHDDKKAIAQTKSRADKKKKEADALQKAHDNFIKEQERLWRAKQQASMPKSWAFF